MLRIDPTIWDEPGLYEELTVGKRCAHLDLKTDGHLQHFKALLGEADVLVHGLRADALERLGLSAAIIRDINPQLIEVTHNAYGWTGPWRNRRGFDSLVQMSSGIADFGMKQQGAGKPHPLPVQSVGSRNRLPCGSDGQSLVSSVEMRRGVASQQSSHWREPPIA